MKRVLRYIALILLTSISLGAAAQGTISATVVDSDSTIWAGGSWQILAITPRVSIQDSPTIASGTLDNSGHFSTSIFYGNYAAIICPHASSTCGTYNFTLATPTLNLSSGINSIITAPRFRAISGTFGYNDTEAQSPVTPGSTYWNVTIACARLYDGSVWACPSSVPVGMIAFIASGTCPAGWAENDSLAGNYILVTTHVAGDVGTSGGSLAYTPSGSVGAPNFTGGSATLTGTVTAPSFTGGSATLTGSVSQPTFSGNNVNTNSVSAGTPSGTVANGVIAWPLGTPTFTGSLGSVPAQVFTGSSGTVPAQVFTGSVDTVPAEVFTGSSATSSAVSGGTPVGTVTASTFTGTAATLVNAKFTVSSSGTAVIETVAGSNTTYSPAGTNSVPTFSGSSLATHTHTLTATGTNATASFTPTGTNGTVSFTPSGTNGTANFTPSGTNAWPGAVPTETAGVFSGSALGTHSHSVTPTGTVTQPTLSMNSYTPAGSNSIPTLSMNSYTPSGTNSAPAFSGAPATITPVFFKMIACSKN